MHSPLSFAVIISLVTLILSASASPLSSVRGTPKCSARDIAIVRRTISDEVYFCKWWLSDIRTRTPFLEFSPAQVTDLCKCIAPVSTKKTAIKQKRAEHAVLRTLEKRQTVASCRAEMSIQFTEPYHFCKFYDSYPRTTSPFIRYSAKGLVKLCTCVEGKAISTPTSKTSTKKVTASSTKVSTKASSKSSSTKPSTKLSSSSTKSKTSTKTSSTTSSSSSKVASSASSKSSSKISSKTSSKSSSRVVSAISSSTSKVAVVTSSKPLTTSTSRFSLVSSSFVQSAAVSTSSLLVSSSRVASSSTAKSSTSSLANSKAPVIPISIPSISTSVKVPSSSQSVSSADSTLQTPSISFALSVIPDSITISTPSVTATFSSSTDASSSYITESSSTDTQVSSTSEASTTETASSTESSASATITSSTSSVAPISTGLLMAKGGVVDGQYWNNAFDSAVPAFSSSPENRVVCTLGDDRVLICDGIPVNILTFGLYAETNSDYGVGESTLRCDRAPDGLLTCDPITFWMVESSGPFASCYVGDYGNTLHYLGNASVTDCTVIDGLYLDPLETPSSSSTTSSTTDSPTPDVITSSTSSSEALPTPAMITSSTSSSTESPTPDVTTSSTSLEESPTPAMITSSTLSSEISPTSDVTTSSTSSSEESPAPDVSMSSTPATYPLPTGVLMAKGGVVDGQYWNNARNTRVPAFSSLETNMVSCSLGDDRVLVCNGFPVNIVGSGLYAQTVSTFSEVGSYTLNCDRAADGLLTCDPITNPSGIYSRGPFATCLTNYGNSLHYFGNTTLTSCTVIDGLYLN